MSAPVDVKDDSAAERWERAAQLAEGVEDDQLRKRRRRVWWLIIGLMGAGFVGGTVLGLVLPSDVAEAGGSTDEQELWTRIVAGGIIWGIGFVGFIAGFVWAKATGHYITRWRAVWSPLNRRERKLFLKQIRLKRPVDEEHLPVLVAGANQARRATIGVAPLYAGIVLMIAGLSFFAGSVLTTWLCVGLLVLYGVVAVIMVIQYRQAGRFLTKYQS